MFEFLRKEIVALRKKNTKLKKDLADAETGKREMFKHSSNLDHSFAIAKIRNEQMCKTNASLLEDNNKRRKEGTKLKDELKTQQQAHEVLLEEMRCRFEAALKSRDAEIATMAQNIRSSAAAHKREVQKVRGEASRKQEEHFSQISRLRDEIMYTQNSHQDYLSKLMDVLENTQESRESGAAFASSDTILRKKDDEISELKVEVARLRKKSTIGGGMPNKEAIKSMKYIIKKNREDRKSRVQYLGVLTEKLEASLSSGDSLQVKNLLGSMKETVRKGEKSNSKMDREMVNMLDNAASYGWKVVLVDTDAIEAESKKQRQQ